jgi:hypothetical protein
VRELQPRAPLVKKKKKFFFYISDKFAAPPAATAVTAVRARIATSASAAN